MEDIAPDRVEVCLIVPPMAAVTLSTLGTAILAAALRERAIPTRVLHANVAMAEMIGFEEYCALGRGSTRWMPGERAFRDLAWPPEVLARMEAPAPLPAEPQSVHEALRPHAAPLVEETAARVAALAPRIVGITSTFQQSLASLAIARRVRELLPDTCIVIGGANVTEPMGSALAETAPWVDHFFSGEADIVFPDFCEALLRDGSRPAARVIECPPLEDMSRSPMPDYSDYYADIRAAQARGAIPERQPRRLMLEFARGCWWGAKNHCTFCGLNGTTMKFREKPVERALAEIDAMEARWGVGDYCLADNILPIRYMRELLPALAARDRGPKLFYEVKSNLTPEQIALLERARVRRVQPGIESFSSPVLKLMRKGVSAHRNLATLRDLRAHGLQVNWYLIYGFPGETVADYESMIELIPAIEHFAPPDGRKKIMIDRFSPYFDAAEENGIAPLRPMPGYQGLFPRDARLADIAYHFEGEYETGFTRDADCVSRLHAAVDRWAACWAGGKGPALQAVWINAGGTVVADSRRIAREPMQVIPHEWAALLRRLRRPIAREQLDSREIEALEGLLERRFVVEHEGMLLSVVVGMADTEGAPLPSDAIEAAA